MEDNNLKRIQLTAQLEILRGYYIKMSTHGGMSLEETLDMMERDMDYANTELAGLEAADILNTAGGDKTTKET